MDLTPSSAAAKHQPREKRHCAERSKPRLDLLLLSRDLSRRQCLGNTKTCPANPVLSAPSRQRGVVAAAGWSCQHVLNAKHILQKKALDLESSSVGRSPLA